MPVNDKVASETWYRFRWCVEHGHYPFLLKADRCEKFFAGLQWEESDLNSLKLQKRPALTINKIISTVSTIMGEQIYNRNETTYRPSGNGANSEVADALTKVYLQVAQQNQLSWVRSDVFADGIIRSRGFYDLRMDFSENIQGDIAITRQNSKNVVIDPDADEYDPDKWNDVFVTKWMIPADIELLYNKEDAEYLRSKEMSLFPYAYDSIERVRDRFAGPQLQSSYYGLLDTAHVRRSVRVLERQFHLLSTQKHFVDRQTGEMRPIPDGWDRDHIARVIEKAQGQIDVISRKIKRVRWTVTADNVVLHDDWSPYKHFTIIPYFPHFRYGTTVGIVESLLGSQELLNKTSSQELHIVNTSANSGWKVKSGNLINMTIEELEQGGAKTGLVVEVNDIAQIEKIQPNNVPQGIDRISYKAEEHMKSISGVSDSMQGFDREDVAAKAIAFKKQSGATNLVKVMDNLERTDFILGRNILDLVQTFYTDERTVHITHSDATAESEEIVVNQYDATTDTILNDLTLGEYGVIITSSPDRATMEDSQFEQAKSLKELGIAIPDEVLIENSRLFRRAEIIKQMKDAANTPEAQQKAKLQMRAMEANVAKLEGEAKEKQTKSALDEARAGKETVETQNLAQGDSGEAQKLQFEQARLEMDRERMQAELQLKREEATAKLQFEREKHEQEMEMRRQEAAQDAEIRRQEAVSKRAQAVVAEASESPTTGEAR